MSKEGSSRHFTQFIEESMRIDSEEIFRGAIGIVISLLLCAGMARAQEWTRVDVSDPAHGRQFTEFTLRGRFLESAHAANGSFPLLILRCQPGRFSSGHLHGKLLQGILHVGLARNGSIIRDEIRDELFSSKSDLDGYYVEFALNDNEKISDHWDNILDYQGVGFGTQELGNILWGQVLTHKEDDTPPTKKFVITVQQRLAGKIVMQFDMPDPTIASELCGCTYFKKKN
jgi:hypothetical protein